MGRVSRNSSRHATNGYDIRLKCNSCCHCSVQEKCFKSLSENVTPSVWELTWQAKCNGSVLHVHLGKVQKSKLWEREKTKGDGWTFCLSGATLDACRCFVASLNAMQCLTKLLPKPVWSGELPLVPFFAALLMKRCPSVLRTADDIAVSTLQPHN